MDLFPNNLTWHESFYAITSLVYAARDFVVAYMAYPCPSLFVPAPWEGALSVFGLHRA